MTFQRIVELRQYTLRPGRRDTLVKLFEQHLVAGQERYPMRVVGQFRDVDRPDRFVWLRDFASMTARHQALTGFYGGPHWRAHRDAANSTMIDSDDVLLMRPLEVIPVVSADPPTRGVTVTLFSFRASAVAEAAHLMLDRVDPLLTRHGLACIAWLETEPSPNSFPALPVHEDRHVLARVSRASGAGGDPGRDLLPMLQEDGVGADLRGALIQPPTHLRLEPTTQSRLR